jgi:hypothetical protein
MLSTLADTTRDPHRVHLIARVDNDDPECWTREKTIRRIYPHSTVLVGPRTGMGTLNAQCVAAATTDLVWLINDDIVHLTPHWDDLVLDVMELCPPPIVMAYPDDGVQEGALAEFPCFPRQDALDTDFFGCQSLQRYVIPVVIHDIYQPVGLLQYFSEWKIRHEKHWGPHETQIQRGDGKIVPYGLDVAVAAADTDRLHDQFTNGTMEAVYRRVWANHGVTPTRTPTLWQIHLKES